MNAINASSTPTRTREADRLSSHLRLCDQARGRWALVGNAVEGLRALLFGHVVSTVVVLLALGFGVAWLGG